MSNLSGINRSNLERSIEEHTKKNVKVIVDYYLEKLKRNERCFLVLDTEKNDIVSGGYARVGENIRCEVNNYDTFNIGVIGSPMSKEEVKEAVDEIYSNIQRLRAYFE